MESEEKIELCETPKYQKEKDLLAFSSSFLPFFSSHLKLLTEKNHSLL
jgi:hypothetical protein